MKKLVLFFSFILFVQLYAQLPGEAYNPMTALGARHIHKTSTQWFAHKLLWENPTNVIYNDVYISTDSNLVISLDPSAKILSGLDSLKTYSSLSLELLGGLEFHTRYYWRVVEYNSDGFTPGPVWNFISQSSEYSYWNDDFSNGLSNYTIIQLPGFNWDISNSSNAGGNNPPELLFYNSGNFIGSSYLILNEIFDLCTSINPFVFNYSVDWFSGEFIIGLVYSLDEGVSWIPFWQETVTEDIPITQIWWIEVPNENYVKCAFFAASFDTNASGKWYIDDLILDTPLTVPTPPAQIKATADSLSQRVELTWVAGFAPDPISGYSIQRKNGLPTDTSSYSTIGQTGGTDFYYSDDDVELDQVYTYRIQTIVPIYSTAWSNEATAYVPHVVPVELISFSSSVVDNDITFNWTTATETNNSGFEIERKQVGSPQSSVDNLEWNQIAFVPGFGTTTEPKSYSFVDKNLSSGKYQYRLKQIDFDGTFEYSNTVEVEINSPTEFSLEQNYPNPFNPTTKIKFTIPAVGDAKFASPTNVILRVFDVLGNEVATLVNEEKPAGEYEVEFSINNLPAGQAGLQLTSEVSAKSGNASGVYFYQLKAGSYIETKKMVLMK
jgi:hypothetical protein